MTRLLAVLVGAVILAGCATAQIAIAPLDAAKLQRRLTGEARFLRVSMYRTPFFGDSTKALLTAVPPDEVELLTNPDGSAISPGEIEAVLPVGTPVRVRAVEFPSATVMAQRVLLTPRTLAWVILEVARTSGAARPVVLVLRPGLSSASDVLAELDRYASVDDPTRRLDAFSESMREAIRAKRAVPEMPAEALEMAWGYPEQKRVELVNAQRKETWKWPRKRSAVLLDGKVTALSGEPERR